MSYCIIKSHHIVSNVYKTVQSADAADDSGGSQLLSFSVVCLFVCLFVCLLEQEAGHVMDVIGLKKIHFLICQHAAEYTEVRTSLVGLHTF